MAGDDLTITGGVGGVTARIDDMHLHADRSDEIGDELRGAAAAFARMAVDGDLAASVVLSPGSAARAEGALVDVGARVTASAVRVEASARGLRTVARAWAAMDTAEAIRADVREVVGFHVLAHVGLPATVAATPFVFGANVVQSGGWNPVTDSWSDLLDVAEDAGRGTGQDLGAAWTDLLLEVPEITDATVEGLGVASSRVAGRPLAYEDTIVMLLGVAGLAGWFDDTAGLRVEPASHDGLPVREGLELEVPRGIQDLFEGQTLLMDATRDDPGSSRLRVIDVGRDGEAAWVVQVPGTQQWGVTAGADPSDLTTNLHLTGPEDAALLDAVDEAMRRAGVGADDPVMVVGHSQGGIAAAAFAAQADDRGLNVTHVVTGGSPVAHVDVPDDVHVLSLEHHNDPVPRLDGDPNPDRPTWTTVVRDAGGADVFTNPIAPHSSQLYADTGDQVDRSDDPSVRAFLDGAARFFPSGGDPELDIQDFTVSREDHP